MSLTTWGQLHGMESSVALSPLESKLAWLSNPTEDLSARGSNWQGLGSLQFILEAPFAIPVAIFVAFWPSLLCWRLQPQAFLLTRCKLPSTFLWAYCEGESKVTFSGSVSGTAPPVRPRLNPAWGVCQQRTSRHLTGGPWNNVNYIFLEWKENNCVVMVLMFFEKLIECFKS